MQQSDSFSTTNSENKEHERSSNPPSSLNASVNGNYSPHRHLLTIITESEASTSTSPIHKVKHTKTDKSDSNEFLSARNNVSEKTKKVLKTKRQRNWKSTLVRDNNESSSEDQEGSNTERTDKYFEEGIQNQPQLVSKTTSFIRTVKKLSFLPLILFSGMTLVLGGLGIHLLMSKSEVPIIKPSPQGNMLSLFPIEMVLFVGLIAALAVACYLFYDERRTKIDESDVSTFASIQTLQPHLK